MDTQIALNPYHNKQGDDGHFYVCCLWVYERICCIPGSVIAASQSVCKLDLTKCPQVALENASPFFSLQEYVLVLISLCSTNSWDCLVLHFNHINRGTMIFHDCFPLCL